MNTIRQSLVAAALVAVAATASASTTVFSGNLGDTVHNAALESGANNVTYGHPADPDDVANNVALYTFDVTLAGTVSIASADLPGGVDPYFTLFLGSGPTATFLGSNYNQAVLGSGGDFTWTGTLAVGTYEIALGTTENISFAEQDSTATLYDGFIGFGLDGSQGNGDYALTLTMDTVTPPPPPIPEPTSALLLGLGLATLAVRARRASR